MLFTHSFIRSSPTLHNLSNLQRPVISHLREAVVIAVSAEFK